MYVHHMHNTVERKQGIIAQHALIGRSWPVAFGLFAV